MLLFFHHYVDRLLRKVLQDIGAIPRIFMRYDGIHRLGQKVPPSRELSVSKADAVRK